MCGIVGYVGKRQAAPILLAGLKRLEYRGYDSAGIAVLSDGALRIVRKKGPVEGLDGTLAGNTGIGHTRWATHGAPSERNAHPHRYGRVAVVHNGIIENARTLKEECLSRGETFSSETDTEVIAHLIALYDDGNLLRAVRDACARLEGSYALAVVAAGEEQIVCARKKSPLIVGYGRGESYLASDLPAVSAFAETLFSLEDGDLARLTAGRVEIFGTGLKRVSRRQLAFDVEKESADLGGFHHYMRKEMSEIPAVLSQKLPDFSRDPAFLPFYRVLCQTQYIEIAACGTAYHAGLCAAEAIGRLCRLPTGVSIASEYRYRDPLVPPHTLFLAVSQSGETADTLAAARLAKERGAHVAAVTNVAYSSLARLADTVLFTNAGREVGVAATKSFNAQLYVLYAVAAELCRARGKEVPAFGEPAQAAASALAAAETVRSWVPHFVGARSVYFIGRGADYCTAREGSLKLKEITYLPGEGYAAGELKHGTLALVDPATPVVAILTDPALAEKTLNAVHEVRSRGAKVFLVTNLPAAIGSGETASVLLPACPPVFSPMLAVIPLQALAYYTAVALGRDPDKPRHLAKSVTVE